jgi:alkylation response protein AidB-like acyl-CoA dehydrogenase
MEYQRLDREDLEIVLGTLREFVENEAPLEKRLEWDAKDVCPEEVIRGMTSPDVGLHLMFIPEEYGGLGGGAYDIYRLCEEFARVDVGLATAVLAIALGTDPIRVGCTPEQRERWMSRIAGEGLLVAYGVTEPEAGSNVESIRASADRITDESGRVTHYRLNGTKQFISNGAIADLFTILARTTEGPTFFVVERGTEGLSPGRQEVKHGIRLSNTSQVILQNVVVPAENLVGAEEGQGIKQSNEVFGYTRLMVAAFGLGCGESALEKAITYSRERKQFGGYLYELQGYTHKLLVPHSVRLAAARAYIEHVADLLDSGTEDRQVEGAVAKYFATEAGNAAAEDAIQALGGYGYCAEYEVEKIKRDARILTIYEGTSEIQQNIIGLFRMRQSVRSKGGFYNGMADEVTGLEQVGGQGVARAARFLSDCAQLTFKRKLSRQQFVLFELATAMADVETAVALCKAAARDGGELMEAQSRLWGARVAIEAPSRLVRAFTGAGLLEDAEQRELIEKADLPGAAALQAGTLADMNLVARRITTE